MTSASESLHNSKERLALVATLLALVAALLSAALFHGYSQATLALPWLVPTCNMLLFLTGGCIAFLSFGRYQVLGDLASFWIGVGSSGFAVELLFNTLSFPGLLPSGEPFISSFPSNTTAWAASSALVIFEAALFAAPVASWPGKQTWTGKHLRLTVALWLTGIIAMSLMMVVLEQHLPVIALPDGTYTALFRRARSLLLGILSIAGTIFAVRRHLRTGEQLLKYLALCQFAMVYVSIVSIFQSARYDLLWFAQRLIWIAMHLVLLFGLLSEYLLLFRKEQEKSRQLRESEERFRSFVEASSQVIWTTNERGEVNLDIPAWQTYTGQTAEEARGFGWIHAIHVDDRQQVAAAWAQAFAKRGVYQVEYRLLRHDGIWRDILARGVPLLDGTGRIREYVGTCIDITERREFERALAEREARFRAIFDYAGVGIVEVAKNDRFIAVNQRMCEMLDYSAEELLRMNVHELTYPEDRALSDEINRKVHDRELARVEYDKRYLKRTGLPLWVHVNVSGVRDAEGNWLRSITTVEDISGRKRAEESLFRSEALFRGIYENAAVGISLTDQEGRLIQANRKLCDILGYDEQTLRGRLFTNLTHPEDVESDWKNYRQMIRGELTSYNLRKRYIRKDGSPVWVRVTRSALKIRDDGPVHGIAIVEDITAKKEAQERLQHTLLLLNAITENTTDFIFMKDLEGRMLLANPATLKDLGKRPEEVLGKTDLEFLGGEAARQIMENDRKVMAAGVTIAFEEVPHPEGDRKVYLSTKSPYKDQEGNVIGLIGISRNITDRKRVEEHLRESRELLETVLETLPVGVWILDAFGKVTQVNHAAQEIWGASRQAIMMDSTEYKGWRLDGRRMLPQEWAGARAIRNGEITLNEEVEIECFDGTRKIILDSAVPIRNQRGETVGAITVNQDITDRKQAENDLRRARDELEVRVRERTTELRQALDNLQVESEERIHAVEELRTRDKMLMQQNRLAAMGEMLGNISHQWRQPLNVVGLLLQDLVRSYEKGRMTKESLEKSVTRARELISHMSRTIDDFRNFLSPERGKHDFQLHEAVEKAVSMTEEYLKGIDVRFVIAEPVSVEGFANEFAQVVMNILVNARDVFLERGIENPCIMITVGSEQGKGIVSIADNGGGIAPDTIDRIFDPYFTTKENGKGTGIGLFMSRNIIEKNMGGSLTVRNTGEGAEFRIEV